MGLRVLAQNLRDAKLLAQTLGASQVTQLVKNPPVPWAARRSNHSIVKEISPEDSLEGLMLKLKLQYFSQLMTRADSLEKTLILGNIKG